MFALFTPLFNTPSNVVQGRLIASVNFFKLPYLSTINAFKSCSRASVPRLSAKSVTMGNNVTIYTNRASSSFTHTIKFKFGAYSATIATDVGTSFTYPTQLAMASYVPNATSGSGTFTVYTYNGSTLIGSKTVNITLNVPSSIVPSISGAATTEANSEVTIGLFVQNISKINVAITASGSYESTISEYTSTFEGKTYKGQTFTIESLNVSGDRELSVNVKDSRGRTATYTRTITINEYANPNISAFSAYRCNSSGIQDDSGSYVKFTYSFNITSLSSKNKHVVKIQYKLNDAADWTDLTSNANYSGANVVYKSGAIFDPNHTYNVRLYVELPSGNMHRKNQQANVRLNHLERLKQQSMEFVCAILHLYQKEIPD